MYPDGNQIKNIEGTPFSCRTGVIEKQLDLAKAFVILSIKFPTNRRGTGQLPPDNCPPKIATLEIAHQIISPWTIGAQTIAPQNN